MDLTNKKYALEFLQHSRDIIAEASLVDPDAKSTRNELAILEIKNAAVKQANNTFRACLQHDMAKAKLSTYRSSFLEDELEASNESSDEPQG